MRNVSLSLLVGSSLLLSLAVACGDDGGTGGNGGSGGTGGTGTSTQTTGVTGPTSTGTGTGMCDGSPYGEVCGPCLEMNCCAEVEAAGGAADDPDLVACAQMSCNAECFTQPEPLFPYECTVPSEAPSAGSCVTVGGGIACNPVTQEGCDVGAGEACDVAQDGFTCYPDGNTQGICEDCGVTGTDYCQAGYACIVQCARYCCSDSDCGAGTCVKDVGGQAIFAAAPDLGLCQDGAGGGGQGGAGGGGQGGGGQGGQGGGAGGMMGSGGQGGM